MRIVYLLFMTIAIVACSGEKDIKREIKKSKLMLEYDWPEPKNLKRLPHPKSCHHFYHIRADGHPVMKKCHGDKIFDYQTLLCRKGSLAKCWNNMLYKKDKSNIKKVRHHFSCPYSWGLYPNPEDCTLFYECLGGIIFSNKCPHAMLFDKVERTCVHSSKATCAEYSDISTTERNSQESFEMRTDFNDDFNRKENSITPNIHIKPTKTLEIRENTSDERVDSEEQKSNTVENTYSTKYLTKFSIVLNKTIKPEQIKILHTSSEENNSEENLLEKKSMQTNTNAETKFMAGISVANKPHEKIVAEMKHSSSVTLTEKDRNTKMPSKISDLFSTTSAVKSSGDTNIRIKPTENVAFKKASAVFNEMSFEEDNSLEEKGVHSKY